MKWYNYLYIGEKAEKDSDKIISNIKNGKLQLNKYVLAIPFNDSDILDIYPAMVLTQKHYMESDLIVVGIASGKEDADNLMQEILLECFSETGGFGLKNYILAGGVSD